MATDLELSIQHELEEIVLEEDDSIGRGSHEVPEGGTTGQRLAKASDADHDLTWLSGGGEGGASLLGELSDVSLSAPADNEFLRHDGNGWVNEDVGFGTAAQANTGLGASEVPTNADLGSAAYEDASAFEASGAVATHSADTTSVHGIADTSNLIEEGDARLTDDRDPNPHTLVSADHTASGLSAGTFLKATGASTFAFAAHGLTASDVGASATGHDHDAAYAAIDHNHDAEYAPLGEVGVIDVQVYDVGDSPAEWSKPTGALIVETLLVGAGGGGGGGKKGAEGTERLGGGAGGAGGVVYALIPATAVASSETVTVGAAGTSGPAASTNGGNGGNGGSGGGTSFGSHVTAGGGSAGNAGGAGIFPGAAGGAGASSYLAGDGGASVDNGGFSTPGEGGHTGGGAGGGIRTAANANITALTGGDGVAGSGGSAGGTDSAGGNGASGTGMIGGAGGGGGGGTANAGGDGGTPGGGGGGGSPGINDTADSGAGGTGGDGRAVVVVYG